MPVVSVLLPAVLLAVSVNRVSAGYVQDLTKKYAALQKDKKRSHEDQESFFCWFLDHADAGRWCVGVGQSLLVTPASIARLHTSNLAVASIFHGGYLSSV